MSIFFINKFILELMTLSVGSSTLQATDLQSWGRATQCSFGVLSLSDGVQKPHHVE